MSHLCFSIDRPDLLGWPSEAAPKGKMCAGALWTPSTLVPVVLQQVGGSGGQGWLRAAHGPDPASSAKAELQARGSLNLQVQEHPCGLHLPLRGEMFTLAGISPGVPRDKV